MTGTTQDGAREAGLGQGTGVPGCKSVKLSHLVGNKEFGNSEFGNF